MRCANLVERNRLDKTYVAVCQYEAQRGKIFCKSCEAKLSVPDKFRPVGVKSMAAVAK